jgi:hypothetical protein
MCAGCKQAEAEQIGFPDGNLTVPFWRETRSAESGKGPKLQKPDLRLSLKQLRMDCHGVAGADADRL